MKVKIILIAVSFIVIAIILMSSFLVAQSSIESKIPINISKVEFSDETLIKSVIHNLEQSVRNKDLNHFIRLTSYDLEELQMKGKNKKDITETFKNLIINDEVELRSNYSRRRLKREEKVVSTSDFQIKIENLKINKNKATVLCQMRFKYDQSFEIVGNDEPLSPEESRNSGKIFRSQKEFVYSKNSKYKQFKIILEKINNKWKIKKLDKFFKFFNDRKNMQLSYK